MDLNLRLFELETPFRLAKKDDDQSVRDDLFSPEDWAWEFLRLNADYQNAYEAAKSAKPLPNGDFSGAFNDSSKFDERIRADEMTCRSRFGLSTWLDPRRRLPKLRGRGWSWFYPLADCKNRPEDSFLPVTLPGLFGPRPLVPFGEKSRSEVGQVGHARGLVASPCVWFAIDCSVPPIAQLATAEAIAQTRRDWLQIREAEARPNRDGEKGPPVPIADCRWFSQDQFIVAGRPAESTDPADLWFAIRVDVQRSIPVQMKHWKRQLMSKNRDLLKDKKAVHFIQKKFKDSFALVDDDGSPMSDGDFLKQRAICAQLSLSGLDAEGIVKYVKDHATKPGTARVLSDSKRGAWNKALEMRVKRYVSDGVKLVNGDYRWLVHAQKP